MTLLKDEQDNIYWQGHEIVKLPDCLARYLIDKTCANCGQLTESAMLFEDAYICLKCFRVKMKGKDE